LGRVAREQWPPPCPRCTGPAASQAARPSGLPYPRTARSRPALVDNDGRSIVQAGMLRFRNFRRRHAFLKMSGWIEDDMNRHDRELLDRQMSRCQLPPRRDGALILAMVGVFIAGLTAGGLLFTFGNAPSTPTASDDGRTALAFLLNGTGSPSRQ
jgi:hypothetical protein